MLVLLYEPFYLGQVALVGKSAGQVGLLYFIVDVCVVLRSDEIKKVLAYCLINWMLFEQIKIWFASGGFLSHYLANLSKRISTFLLKKLINMLECLSKI
jgi:hypothetical protein